MSDNLTSFLERHLVAFLVALQFTPDRAGEALGLIIAHGDKTHQYKRKWEDAGISYEHGSLLYLLSYLSPYNAQSRIQIKPGGPWRYPVDWVIENYFTFKHLINAVEITVAVDGYLETFESLAREYIADGVSPEEAIQRASAEVKQLVEQRLEPQ